MSPISGKITNHHERSVFDAAITIFVGIGNWPPSDEKTLWNTGTMKRSMNVSTSDAKHSTTAG